MTDTRSTASSVCDSPASSPCHSSNSSDTETISTTSSLFSDSNGDTLLRTKDAVQFRVSKATLRIASPLFRILLSLHEESSSEQLSDTDSTPVITVDESSDTIDLLLRFLYPTKSPDLADASMSVVLDLLWTSRKYEIESIVDYVHGIFRRRVGESRDIAIASYMIACRFKLEDEARLAARTSLKWPILGVSVPELKLVSGIDYFNLLDYHDRACKAVSNLRHQLNFKAKACSALYPQPHTPCESPSEMHEYKNGDETTPLSVHSWFDNWEYFLLLDLQNAPLAPKMLSTSRLASYLKGTPCHECKDRAFAGWDDAKEGVTAAIVNEVNKVNLELSWK